MNRLIDRLVFVATSLVALAGCGSEGGVRESFGPEESLPITARYTTVVVETCELDTWQSSALASQAMRAIVKEVVLVCPAIRADGTVAPADPDARAALATSASLAKQLGYVVRLGVAMGDDRATFPKPYTDPRAIAAFSDPAWRQAAIANLAPFAAMADGLEIDIFELPDATRVNVTAFFAELDASIRKGNVYVGLMAPPSTQDPSDTPGGNAFDLAAISPHVDRVRMMTLDFSAGGPGGPDLDTGWAVDVGRFAKSRVTVPVDVAFPLYGTDFSPGGSRFVSWAEGRATADDLKITPDRDASGELNFAWNDEAGIAHRTWFEDGVSASRALHAWDTSALPSDVGVVLYGLGAEDPALWDTLARGLR